MAQTGGYVPSASEAPRAKPKEGDNGVSFLLMEDLADKLRLLDYESKFCKGFMRGTLKPLRPGFLAVQAPNTAEQFFYTTQLMAWLMNSCNQRVTAPSRTDDPNATTATLIEEMKKMGLPTDFPPMKLKQGYGEVVCGVLNELAKMALAASGFRFEAPVHNKEADAARAAAAAEEMDDGLEDEAEAEGEEMVEETLEDEDDEDDLAFGGAKIGDLAAEPAAVSAAVDPVQWRLEVERVTPQLRVQVVQDTKDWRARRDEIKKSHEAIIAALASVKPTLERISSAIAKELEKITTRERFLNEQFEGLIAEHRSSQEVLNRVTLQHKAASDRVTALTKELSTVVDELAGAKEESESLASAVNDSSPVLRMKAALAKLKEEIQSMEVRIGVAQHTIMRAMLREKQRSLKASGVSSTSPGIAGRLDNDIGLNASKLGMSGVIAAAAATSLEEDDSDDEY